MNDLTKRWSEPLTRHCESSTGFDFMKQFQLATVYPPRGGPAAAHLVLVRSMVRWHILLTLFVSSVSCQTTEREPTYFDHGQKYCSKHRVPFVTRRVFEPAGVVLVHYIDQRCIDCRTESPNCILHPAYSVHRTSFYSSPTVYSYCPRCEDEFRACTAKIPCGDT